MSNSETQVGARGPFEVKPSDDSQAETQEAELPRQLDCANYERCLDLAVALNWEGFTCQGCCGAINECLTWRARQVSRKDAVAKALCGTPKIETIKGCKSVVKKVQNS